MAATGSRTATRNQNCIQERRSNITMVATALERPNEGDEGEWVFIDGEDPHHGLWEAHVHSGAGSGASVLHVCSWSLGHAIARV
jgi:hypothetical protein